MLLPGQQGCPEEPHAAQDPAEQAVKGAVHFAPPTQQGVPAVPHPPPAQPPPTHMPWVGPHVDPDAMHTPATQHPPPAQTSPSQHGWPVPPHVVQVPAREHVWPLAVQKSAERPCPPGDPAQQVWPPDPQVPQPSLLMLQVPSEPPHG